MSTDRPPLIVSWAWGHPKYRAAARQLMADCDRLGYAHHVEIEPDLSEHLAAQVSDDMERRRWIYRWIPVYLDRLLQGPVGPDLLYLHADFRLRSPVPVEAFSGLDIGVEAAWSKDKPNKILAAPVFLRRGEPARRFVRLWKAYGLNLDDGRSEHTHLWDLWRYLQPRERTMQLGTFDPPIFSISPDRAGEVPIHGHK